MIEAVWIAGLVAAALIPGRRHLAALVAIKAVASYVGFLYVSEAAPTVTDIVIGTVAIPLCLAHRSFRGDLLAVLFVAFPLIHWLYWSAAEVGLWFPSGYYDYLRYAYSAMVAVIFPWSGLYVVVMGCYSWLRVALRSPSRVQGQTPDAAGRDPTRSATTERG